MSNSEDFINFNQSNEGNNRRTKERVPTQDNHPLPLDRTDLKHTSDTTKKKTKQTKTSWRVPRIILFDLIRDNKWELEVEVVYIEVLIIMNNNNNNSIYKQDKLQRMG